MPKTFSLTLGSSLKDLGGLLVTPLETDSKNSMPSLTGEGTVRREKREKLLLVHTMTSHVITGSGNEVSRNS